MPKQKQLLKTKKIKRETFTAGERQELTDQLIDLVDNHGSKVKDAARALCLNDKTASKWLNDERRRRDDLDFFECSEATETELKPALPAVPLKNRTPRKQSIVIAENAKLKERIVELEKQNDKLRTLIKNNVCTDTLVDELLQELSA